MLFYLIMELFFSCFYCTSVVFASDQELFLIPKSSTSLSHGRNGAFRAGHLSRVCCQDVHPTPVSVGTSFDLVQTNNAYMAYSTNEWSVLQIVT